jgi:hypothetical protein
MRNAEVQKLLDSCVSELAQVKAIIDGLAITSSTIPYLTKYSVIRACGTIEQSFKSILADFCSAKCEKQVKRFIGRRVRDSSMNPSYSNICKLVMDFDEDWLKTFKAQVGAAANPDELLTSVQSLVDARNDFSHGGNPSATIGDVIKYFSHSRAIIEMLDSCVV